MKLFSADNAVRCFHFFLTIGIFLLLLESPSGKSRGCMMMMVHVYIPGPIDLRDAWIAKSPYFFIFTTLMTLSLFVYLLASLVNPGYLLTQNPESSMVSVCVWGVCTVCVCVCVSVCGGVLCVECTVCVWGGGVLCVGCVLCVCVCVCVGWGCTVCGGCTVCVCVCGGVYL